MTVIIRYPTDSRTWVKTILAWIRAILEFFLGESPVMRSCLKLDTMLSFFLGNALTMAFYKLHGLTQAQIFIVQATLSAATVFADIPAGHLADRFGVPRSTLVGTLMQTTQSLFYLVSYGFLPLECLAASTGVSWCFLSNTTTSIMQSQHDDELYNTYAAKAALLRPIARASGALVGGLLVTCSGNNVNVPYMVQPIINGCAIFAAWRLVVLSRGVTIPKPKHALLGSVWAAIKLMLITLPQVRWIVIISAINNAACMACILLLLPALEHIGFKSYAVFGILYALQALLAGVVGSSKRLLRIPLFKGQLLICAITTVSAFAAGLPIGLAGIFVLLVGDACVSGTLDRIQAMELNRLLPKNCGDKTTILSVNTAVRSLTYAVAGYLLGSVAIGIVFVVIGLGVILLNSIPLQRLYAASRPAKQR